jgi:poly(A) polymerase
MISTENQSQRRFHWEEAPWYIYSSDEDRWATCAASDNEARRLNHKQDEDLVVVTWNVLFDIFDEGLEMDEPQLNCNRGATHPSQARWEMLASILHSSEPDVVSLQEATPAFVKILLECEWIKAEYACSASPSSLQSISPSGGKPYYPFQKHSVYSSKPPPHSLLIYHCAVLLLWNRSTLAPHSKDYALFQCSDFGRNRSLVATLVPRKKSNGGSVLAVCSAHLPADKATLADTEKSSRKLARKLELSSILGQLQRLREQLLSKRAVSVTPIVAGDFNCDDDELLDGLFAGSLDNLYCDVWRECEEGPGLTFDPANNRRAARSSALVGGDGQSKRIDRIFVGPTYTSRGHLRACTHMIPKSTTLIGNEIDIVAPSDHFGVRASFQCSPNSSKAVPSTYEHSLWAANAPPSPRYILAVILDNPKLQLLKAQNDQQSSLRALHVTLLHGFIQADFGCMDLVKSAMNNTLHYVNSCAPPPESLVFTKDNSLGVFEHRASATLVACPDIDSQGSQWLRQLYSALRERFQLCNEQERHSSTGWNPHGKTFQRIRQRRTLFCGNVLTPWIVIA